jgi:hypothetical protein
MCYRRGVIQKVLKKGCQKIRSYRGRENRKRVTKIVKKEENDKNCVSPKIPDFYEFK